MHFTDLFIKRPVLASVVSLMILLIGSWAGFKLPIRQYPELSNTTITVTTTYPGANADLIQGFITVPIQQAVASAEGIDTLTASSTQNVSTVTLNLKLDADPDRAMTDVLSKIAQVKGILPREANDSVVTKQTGEGYALMYLSFNSKVMNSSQISDYLNRVVQPKLQTVNGVANAQILGGQTFAMRIWLDPDRMASLGVTPLDVRAALAANNFTSAPGQVKGDYVQTNIDAKTSLDDPAAFGRLVVMGRGDSLVRLSDIAEIELGPQSADSSSVFDGLKAVFIGVYATPTANPLTVITDVRKAFPEIQRELPPGLDAAIAYDATKFIEASIREVATTLVEATYLNSYVAHATMETHSAVAQMENGRMTVWASTQAPFSVKNQVAQALGLTPQDVRIIVPFVGGGFGGKSPARQAIEAARLAKLVGRPVQVVWDRREEFFYDTFRPAAVVKAIRLPSLGFHSHWSCPAMRTL